MKPIPVQVISYYVVVLLTLLRSRRLSNLRCSCYRASVIVILVLLYM